ncbi:vesicle-trafficking protein SEC22a-like isoform X2 [Orbicella faveolata]|uniref:vesicle-trafficking protein SEC22a-like isoform X2 n=1 Tax=Orbicella faveolata TaxID=48498 RepID=UPI0009E38EAF|nr:vesicle-trafficking protein SEC22a-like isoform X2 [Orbicella faveolata]
MIRGIAGLGKWLKEHNLAVKNMQNELASEAKLRTTRSPCPNPWLPYTPTLWETADSFIQKTKQRYNNTRTLTSRLNLSEMSEDLHNNPPFEILQTELGPENNADVKTYKTGGPMRQLEPLTWQSLTACVLAGVCGLLNFLRCFPFLNIIVIDEETNDTWFSAAGFFLAGVLNCCQLYLLFFSVRWRMPLARSLFVTLLLVIYWLRSLRNIWQILFHLTVIAFVLYQTTKRQLQEKPPDYNV